MRRVLTLALMIVAILLSTSVYAQPSDPAHEGHAHPSIEAEAQHSMGMHGWQARGPGNAMSLTPDQRARVRELRRTFIGENAQLIGALVAKRLEFHSLWSDPKADPKAIMEKGRELGSLQSQLREKVLQAMIDARSFLTPEQITRLKHRWAFHHRMMGPRGRGRGAMMMERRGMERRGMMGGEMMEHGGMMSHGGMMGGRMPGHGSGMMDGCSCGMMGGGMSDHGSGGATPPAK